MKSDPSVGINWDIGNMQAVLIVTKRRTYETGNGKIQLLLASESVGEGLRLVKLLSCTTVVLHNRNRPCFFRTPNRNSI